MTIHTTPNEEQNLSSVIHAWKAPSHIVTLFIDSIGRPSATLVNQKGRKFTLSPDRIRGIPTSASLMTNHRWKQLLGSTYIQINPTSDGSYGLHVFQKGLGGGEDEEDQLFAAIKQGDLQKTQILLEKDPQLINALNAEEMTPLHIAAMKGNLALIKYLLDSGADPFKENDLGLSSLKVAEIKIKKSAATHSPEITQLFKEAIDKRFFEFVKNRDAKEAAFLLDKGAAIHYLNPNSSPLHAAIYNADLEMITLLLKKGAKPEGETQTPYELAKTLNNKRVLEILDDYLPGGISSAFASKIEMVKQKGIHNKEFQAEEPMYIPANGKTSPLSDRTFPLEGAMMNFLNHPTRKVFLILGESGSGKSTFGQYIIKKLLEGQLKPQPIGSSKEEVSLKQLVDSGSTRFLPLFIELPSLRNPVKNAIEEHLDREGFSKNEITSLKENYQFLFYLDAYDEIKGEDNLYITNKLEEWKAKVVITCRNTYLKSSFYRPQFEPYPESKDHDKEFTEAFVALFSAKERDDYLERYIKHFDPPHWKTVDEYVDNINRIIGLKSLVENPFILKIAAEVLPEIVKDYEKGKNEKTEEELKVERYDVYKAFLQSSFNRNERKLMMHANENLFTGGDLKQLFWDFSKELAYAMDTEGKTQVEYEQAPSLFGSTKVSKWDRFFGSERKEVITAIRGAPLRQPAPQVWAFLHTSILEFLVAEYLIHDAQSRIIDADTLDIQMEGGVISSKMAQRACVGSKYYIMETVTHEEAQAIKQQTGLDLLSKFSTRLGEIPVNLGSGHFGSIGVAYRKDGEYVAYKKIVGKQEITLSKIEAKMQMLARGKNVMPIYHTLEQNQNDTTLAIYHFMPLAGYGSGYDLLQKLGAMRNRAMRVHIASLAAKQLIQGVKTLSGRHAHHLDLKPENVLISKNGELLVTDFGCSQYLPEGQMTKKGTGDKRFFAPERASKSQNFPLYAEKVDLYAVGVSIIEWCFGEEVRTMDRWTREKYFADCDYIPQEFKDVVLNMLNEDPLKRDTASELLKKPYFMDFVPKGTDMLTHPEAYDIQDQEEVQFMEKGTVEQGGYSEDEGEDEVDSQKISSNNEEAINKPTIQEKSKQDISFDKGLTDTYDFMPGVDEEAINKLEIQAKSKEETLLDKESTDTYDFASNVNELALSAPPISMKKLVIKPTTAKKQKKESEHDSKKIGHKAKGFGRFFKK